MRNALAAGKAAHGLTGHAALIASRDSRLNIKVKSGAALRNSIIRSSRRDAAFLKARLSKSSVAASAAGSSGGGDVRSYTQMRGGKLVTVRGYKKA